METLYENEDFMFVKDKDNTYKIIFINDDKDFDKSFTQTMQQQEMITFKEVQE